VTPVFRHGRLRLYLLKLLDEAPRHGYEVIRLLQDRFLGVYSPSPGTIYPRLARLEAEGLVTRDEADGKKVYRITDKGRQELRNRIDDLSDLEDELSASARGIAMEIGRDVRDTVRSLREDLGRAARNAGTQHGGPGRDPWSAASTWSGASSRADPSSRPGSASWSGSGSRADPRSPADADPRPGAGLSSQPGPGTQPGPGAQPRQGTQPGPGSRPAGSWADLERLAADFAREIVSVAARARFGLDEAGLRDLRGILTEALIRIRTEVFGPAAQTGAAQSTGADQAPEDTSPTA
jgi:DNA-binding PadR family transcriptional regulator